MSDEFNADPTTPVGPPPSKNGKPKKPKPLSLRIGVPVTVAPIPPASPRTHIATCLTRRQSVALLSLRYSLTGEHATNRQGRVVDSTNATIRHLIDILADQLGIPEDTP